MHMKTPMAKRRAVSVVVEVNEVGIRAPLDAEAVVVRAVKATLNHHKIEHASMSVTLMGDKHISALNKQYLERNDVTDVISFPLYSEGENAVGDIYIGWEQCERQAAEADIDLSEEAARLAIHGTLHVLGYDHPEEEDRTHSEMWQLQEQILREMRAP